MPRDDSQQRAESVEEQFFRREDQKLLERLRAMRAAESARDALSKASGVTDARILDQWTALGITHEDVAALSVVPLVQVAWADGSLDDRERAAVLQAAGESGIAAGSAPHALLESWLANRPGAHLFTAWTHLVQGMSEKLAADELRTFKTALLERAQQVARASGGILGLGSKVSASEAAMLTKLEQAFTRTR